MKKSIGMAIKITAENREKLAIVNGGIAPDPETLNDHTYFFFPYDFDSSCDILSEDKFRAKYMFANWQNDDCFVDVDEI